MIAPYDVYIPHTYLSIKNVYVYIIWYEYTHVKCKLVVYKIPVLLYRTLRCFSMIATIHRINLGLLLCRRTHNQLTDCRIEAMVCHWP